MNRQRLAHAAWFTLVLLLGIILWRMWIPPLAGYEAPQWDESDRAQDAMMMAQGLRHFNPLEFFHQLFFFQTWGPGFSILAQLPLFLFGFNAHSLTLIPFLSLVVAALAFASVVQQRAGWATAVAVSLFSAFWILNTPAFAPYYSIFMIDGWSIVGWTGIVIAGSLASSALFIAASWLLFAMKFQYYAVFFMAFAAYIVIVARKNLLPFAQETLKPVYAKILAGLIAIAVLHVLVMKVCGPIYGEPTWDQPRALRNPILYGFLLAVILIFAKRDVFFRYLIKRDWEAKYVKYFLFPTSIFMAMPWPNRWAAVTVTQNQQDDHGLKEKVAIYSEQVTATLHWPQVAYALLLLLIVTFAIAAVRSKPMKNFNERTLPSFVAFMVFIHIVILFGAVKHMDIRYALSLFLSIPTGLFIASIVSFQGRARTIIATTAAALMLALLVAQNPLANATEYFTGHLSAHVNKSFTDNADLYPLDGSLGVIAEQVVKSKSGLSKDNPVRLGILSDTIEWDWNLSMRVWQYEFEAHKNIWVSPTIYLDDDQACANANQDHVDVLVRAKPSQWEIVPCAQH